MPTDIKQTSTGDVDLTTGDIQWTESTAQHQRDLLLGRKYDYRQAPGVGVDAESFLLDDFTSPDDINREIRVQYMRDGMEVKKINYPFVDADYKDS
ncbi:MAG: hypothetical protein ACK4EY_16160 [Flavipsychrobacter sp.]